MSVMNRRLAAIVSADVEGYSRLMAEDEAATVRTVTIYREAFAAVVARHRGRIVDDTGDNVLAEFASVVDAVEGAIEIQREIARRNAELPPQRQMRFRIGINLGDVIADGERIYGDGVNVAARVQTFADGGGIAVSGIVHDQIEAKLPLAFDDLGEQSVKNIARPVRVYRARLAPRPVAAVRGHRPRSWHGIAAAAVVLVALGAGGALLWSGWRGPSPEPRLALPAKPSIAVLPFANLSDDPQQEYFSDGMTEEIITQLSRVPELFVIARNSVFTYKGTAVKVQQVGRELGVHYVLEGSIRKAGRQVRITAQLVDAQSGHHLWAERYDGDLEDVFALQDDITRKIVTALAVTLAEQPGARPGRARPANPEAYDYVLRGSEYVDRGTKEANALARQMFERAIELDPRYAVAYAALANTYWLDWAFQRTQSPETLGRAFELAQKALALDDRLVEAHKVLAHVYLWQKRHDRAIEEAQWVIALAPNDADGYAYLADILTWAGTPEPAVELLGKAMRLNPRYPDWYLYALGHAHRLAGHHEDAIAAHKQALARNPDWLPSHAELAVIYLTLGRSEDAQAAAAQCRRLSPSATLQSLARSLPYREPAQLERYLDTFKRLGFS